MNDGLEKLTDIVESMIDSMAHLVKRIEALELQYTHIKVTINLADRISALEARLPKEDDTVMVRGFPFDVNEFIKKED